MDARCIHESDLSVAEVYISLASFAIFTSSFCGCVLQAYENAQAGGKELEVVYVPVADSDEVRARVQEKKRSSCDVCDNILE